METLDWVRVGLKLEVEKGEAASLSKDGEMQKKVYELELKGESLWCQYDKAYQARLDSITREIALWQKAVDNDRALVKFKRVVERQMENLANEDQEDGSEGSKFKSRRM